MSSGILEVKESLRKRKKWMKVKPSHCNDTKSGQMGCPKLGLTKWQEEDKKLKIKQHYLLMQRQAGRITSESPVDLVGGQIHQTWRGRGSRSGVHSAGTSLR